MLQHLEHLIENNITFTIEDKNKVKPTNSQNLYSDKIHSSTKEVKEPVKEMAEPATATSASSFEKEKENHSFTKTLRDLIQKGESSVISKFTNERHKIMATQLMNGNLLDFLFNEIADNITKIITTDTLETKIEKEIEAFKNTFLKEGKISVGKLFSHVINLFVESIDKLLEVLKELLEYIITNISDFLQMAVKIMQDLKVPTEHLPLFLKNKLENSHINEVLLIALSIPYTAFQKFMDLKPYAAVSHP